MTQGRPKGVKAEREVAALLQEWWRQLEPECLFVRTPASGGWSQPKVRAEFRTSGDVMTTAKCFPFSVEVKRREGWRWSTLRAGKPSPVWAWWRQAQAQAREMGSEPMLWLRHSREPWMVMIPRERFDHLTVCHSRANVRWDGRWSTRSRGRRPVCVPGAAILCEHPRLFLPETLVEMGGEARST